MQQTLSNSDRVQEVALAILAYLDSHPHAKDTLEGIAHWWVGAEVTLVRKALDILVRNGEVAENGCHYSRRPQL